MATRTRTKSARPAKEAKAKTPKKPARKSAHKDAKLLALWARFEAVVKIKEINEGLAASALANGGPKDVIDTADDAASAAYDELGILVDEIGSLPATTVEGIKVKAQAFAWLHPEGLDAFGESSRTTDYRLARQIVSALLTV